MKNNEKMKKSINKYFNKDDNYKKITQDMDKSKCTNIIWKYSLIPICLVVVFGGLIFTNFGNNKNDFIFEESFIEGKNIIKSTLSNSQGDKLLSDDFATLVKHSDAVVKGTVKSVNYEIVGRNAWTKIIFHVDHTINGYININEDIEVHFMGGYISLEDHIKTNDDAFRFEDLSSAEIKNTVIKEIVDGEDEFIKSGEELVLCIVKNPGYYLFPKDSYLRILPSGMLKLKGSQFVQLYGEAKNKYSVSKAKLNDIKKLEVK